MKTKINIIQAIPTGERKIKRAANAQFWVDFRGFSAGLANQNAWRYVQVFSNWVENIGEPQVFVSFPKPV